MPKKFIFQDKQLYISVAYLANTIDNLATFAEAMPNLKADYALVRVKQMFQDLEKSVRETKN